MVPEHCSHHSFVWQCSFEFLGLVGRMRVHPLFRLLFGLCICELYPSLVTSHDSVKKIIPLFPVALRYVKADSILWVLWKSFWYPPCTQLTVTLPVHDNSIQSTPQSLWKFFRKFWYHETFSMHALVNFLNEFISHNWLSSLTTFVMHISAPIPEFSAPFSHTTVTHNIITIYTTQSMMKLGCALSFCVKKTNHSVYLTAGGSGNDSVHVSSVITPTLHSKNVWG